MNLVFFIFFFMGWIFVSGQSIPHTAPSDSHNNAIGLTLSGGGARGLAHVGVLHVIDSLGLKIDYISGTSMGGIVGGLYAVGYSAREIEEIALSVDWERIFNAQSNLEFVHPRIRRDAGRSILELPLQARKLRLPTGAIEGQQLWNMLEELFFHVRTIDAFSQFHIPFACVATDVETGEAIIMKEGDIVSALRASMSIPAVFSTVQREGHQLIDGGVANNFPADVVQDMGAEYVIGVYVSEGLKPADRLRTPLDIIYQMGFFKDAYMLSVNREKTNLFIQPDLEGFTLASFSQVEAIIEKGKEVARSFIPEMKALLETQTAPDEMDIAAHDSRDDSIVVDSIIFTGLRNVRISYIRNMHTFRRGDSLHIRDINRLINRMYATDYFERITYTYIPSADHPGMSNLHFSFSEKPFSRVSTSMHYSSFNGVGIIGGITSNKFLLYNLNAHARARIGEQPGFRAGFDIYTNERQRSWVSMLTSADLINFPVYERFEQTGRYRQQYARIETAFNKLAGPNAFVSAGIAAYRQRLIPIMRTDIRVSGRNHANEAFVAYNAYTLNRHAMPTRGQNLTLRANFFFNQNPEILIESGGQISTDLQAAGIKIKNFIQVKLNWESYVPVTNRLTIFSHTQGGYNFNYTQGFINMFNLGGTYPFLRDQITFAGLNEYGVMTASAATSALGWRYHIWSDFYLTPMINVGLYDFHPTADTHYIFDKLLTGASMSIGYLSPLGPLKTTISYSMQTRKFTAYINLGWPL